MILVLLQLLALHHDKIGCPCLIDEKGRWILHVPAPLDLVAWQRDDLPEPVFFRGQIPLHPVQLLLAGLHDDHAFRDEGRFDGKGGNANDGPSESLGNSFRDTDMALFLLLGIDVHHDIGEAHCSCSRDWLQWMLFAYQSRITIEAY